MRQLQNLFGAAMLFVTALTLTGCGLSDNALEEIINNINSSPGNEEEETVIIPYTCRDYKEGTIQADNSVTFAKATRDTDPTKLTDATTNQTWAGWYYVEGNVTIGAPGSEVTITLSDETHLILCDGATLTINGMINGGASAPYQSLYIYGQATGDGKMVVSNTGTYPVFIHLNTWQIHGGEITASVTGTGNIITSGFDMLGGKLIAEKSSADGQGYGINANDALMDIKVYGGVVKAKGRGVTDSDGGMCVFNTKKLYVYGGEVTAIGNGSGGHGVEGNVEVLGTGSLTATGAKGRSGGPGAGSGVRGSLITNSSGDIKLTGGEGDGNNDGGSGLYLDLTADGSGTIEITGVKGAGSGSGGMGVPKSVIVDGSVNITIVGGEGGDNLGNGGIAVYGKLAANGSGNIIINGGNGSTAYGGHGVFEYLTTGTGCTSKITITGGNGASTKYGGYGILGKNTASDVGPYAINYSGGTIVVKGGNHNGELPPALGEGSTSNHGYIKTSSATNYYTWDGTTWTSAGPVNGVSAAISARGVALPTMPTE